MYKCTDRCTKVLTDIWKDRQTIPPNTCQINHRTPVYVPKCNVRKFSLLIANFLKVLEILLKSLQDALGMNPHKIYTRKALGRI